MERLSLLAALTLVVPMLLFAAPPINDAFDAPSVLSGFPTTTIGTNIDATLETGEPVGEEWDKASVWFRWISPVTGPVQIDTLGSDFDTELAVWNGNALSNLTFLVGNDDYEGSQSAVFIAAISGVTYQISVYGYDDARGVIKLNITNDVTSHISGRVTGPDGIMPLQGIQATAYRWSDSGWDWIQAVDTDANGNYTIGGLPAGTYRVEFNDWQNGDYLSEVYDNVSDWDSGTDIVVAAETTVTDIDASLGIASKISGRVTGPDGIMPIQGIQATAYRWTGSWWDWMQASDTDANGDYIIGGLLAGTYRVQFEDWENGDYASCVYDNASNLDSGTDIVLAAETVVTGIDASLANASKISGRVTGPDGSTPLEGIEVSAYHWVNSYGDWGDYVYTDVNGDYTFGGLPAGTYRVQFYDSTGGYIYECYDNAADLNSGTDIVVATETTVTGIDASLALASKISGTVTGSDGFTPLQGIEATAYHWTGLYGDWGRSVETDVNGSYTIRGLPAGTYRVQFYNLKGDYISEFYDNELDLYSGTDIDVPTATSVTGIDASLANASKISGTVTGSDGFTPLQGIEARAYRWTGSDWGWTVGSDYTDANGDYTIGGLSAGTYRIRFEDWQNDYRSEFYDNALDFDYSADIVVPAATSVTGIDASLSNVVSLEPRFVGLRQTGVKDWELLYIGDVGEAYILQKVASLTDLWEDEGESFLCQPGTNAISRESFSPVLFWRLRTFP